MKKPSYYYLHGSIIENFYWSKFFRKVEGVRYDILAKIVIIIKKSDCKRKIID
jgi:hypothetical protein